ncbi:MAG: GPI mannosyltransferase 1 [Thelocarpon superellum]|nr:MAG: GPI mannosyltransferase 1 [Thelocarpon superellum]
MSTFFTAKHVFVAAALLRLGLFSYGLAQDAYSPVKYTDIDYYVFTDAARFVSEGRSPYDRATYRYTPLLAWTMLPAVWRPWTFSFGKIVFALADLVAGWLIRDVLRARGMPELQALQFSSIWLLNPMVAAISTRGSAEGLLGVMVVALLYAVTRRRIVLAGLLLGLAVHFKIYPFIYGPTILWWLDDDRLSRPARPAALGQPPVTSRVAHFFNAERLTVTVVSLITFMGLNLVMYSLYGWPFVQHTYLHHVSRIDHRHNFSVYNTLLHLNASPAGSSDLRLESLAFIPQLSLAALILPLMLAKLDLASTMLAQTFAFVTFNKVCTSQYFLWYLTFLPFYLPNSSLRARRHMGLLAAFLWVLGQALWLQQAFRVELLGISTFVPALWAIETVFFAINVWILGVVVSDIKAGTSQRDSHGLANVPIAPLRGWSKRLSAATSASPP